ncbi:MAG TPA: hypothetical protein PLZ50_07200, partial [Rubrivivax sp.]|nr:hypothetical protein [Rubrivivax sp.]
MQNIDVMLEPLRALLVEVGAFLPRLAMAIVIVLAGWLLAKALRFAAVRALRAINFDVLTERAGIDGFLRQGGFERDTTALTGALVYGVVILGALLMTNGFAQWITTLAVVFIAGLWMLVAGFACMATAVKLARAARVLPWERPSLRTPAAARITAS